MDELNHWWLFLNSGSVLDYLAYRRDKESMRRRADADREDRQNDEISDRGIDHPRTEYR